MSGGAHWLYLVVAGLFEIGWPLGLKLAWQPTPDWTADVKLEHYAQRGDWYLGQGSTGLAPFAARSWQLGLSRSF